MTALPKFYFLAASKEVLLSLSTQHSSTGRLAGWLKMLKKFVPDGRNRHMYHTHPGTIFIPYDTIQKKAFTSRFVSTQRTGVNAFTLQLMEGIMMITHRRRRAIDVGSCHDKHYRLLSLFSASAIFAVVCYFHNAPRRVVSL